MNSRQIEIFHAVMKAGTVTKAASQLGISQPAVTTSLKQIEAALGFNLFHRAGGRLHATAEAHTLFNEAERLQNSLLMFKKLAERLKKDLTTHLRIACVPALSDDLIPDAIARFTAETRSCLIDMTSQHQDSILKDLSNSVGDNNLGFTFGLDDRPGLGSVLIGKSKIVALVPKTWPLAKNSALHASDLVELPLIGTFPGEPLGNAIDELMLGAGISGNTRVRVHNHSVAANLVNKGVGATLIDSITAARASHLYGGDTFVALPVHGAPVLNVTAVYAYEHPLNKHAKRFVDIVREGFKRL